MNSREEISGNTADTFKKSCKSFINWGNAQVNTTFSTYP